MSATVPATDIIAVERAALDRWGAGDPSAYLALFEPDVTYFDPFQERRVDGVAAMAALFAPIAGKIRVDRYDMIDATVQHGGGLAHRAQPLVVHQARAQGRGVGSSLTVQRSGTDSGAWLARSSSAW